MRNHFKHSGSRLTDQSKKLLDSREIKVRKMIVYVLAIVPSLFIVIWIERDIGF